MSTLCYLALRTLKNFVRELFKKPAQLILYLVLVLAFGGMIVLSFMGDDHEMGQLYFDFGHDALAVVCFLFILVFVASAVIKGLSTGSSFFTMADVNMLFVSPVDPAHILTYGMLKQAGTAMLAGIFVPLNAANFRNFFGVGPGGTAAVFLGYVLAVAASESLAMLVYAFTNGRVRRQAAVRVGVSLILLPVVIHAGYGVMTQGLFAGLMAAANSTYASLVPVVGWAVTGIMGLIDGHILKGLFFLGLNLATCFVALALIRRYSPNYYEDVLVATEVTTARKAVQATGDANALTAMRSNIRVRGTGIQGRGASAIMGRQLREMMRLSRFGPLDTYSLSIIGVAVVMSFMNRDGGLDALPVTFIIILYMQLIFLSVTGPIKELSAHYIFLIPESPFKKLLWNNAAPMLKCAIELAIAFGASAILLRAPIIAVVASYFVSLCFCFMLMSLNVWGLRFFGTVINRGLLMIFYLLLAVLVSLPGILLGVLIAFQGPLGSDNLTYIAPLAAFAVYELLVALLLTYWSRGVLHKTDMITIQAQGK